MFAGSIPEVYDRYLVPLIFEPYAIDLARRVASLPLTNVLELAAGTGVLTRRLAMSLPRSVWIVATDVSPPMLEHAATVGTCRAVEWRQADALSLPFDQGSFDAVVCQFGVMFFPERTRCYAEARRVLRRGGVFVFNVWDRLEENEFPYEVDAAVAALYDEDPPHFMAQMPHGYHDIAMIRRDLAKGGFSQQPEVVTVQACSRAASPRIPAIAFCQGTPLRCEIEARVPNRLAAATDAAETAIARRFGYAAVDGRISAHVIVASN
jgi:SAM-dependent methyltransferase